MSQTAAPPSPLRSVTLGGLALAAALAGCGLGERPLPHDLAPPERVARGRQLIEHYQCGSCHAIPGVSVARGNLGPSLAAFGRRSYIAGHLPNDPATLARWIALPASLVPGTPMPAMGASADDARDMAAYLLSLK